MPRVVLRLLAIVALLIIAVSVGSADPITLNYRHYPARSIHSPAEHFSDPFDLRAKEINSSSDENSARNAAARVRSRLAKERLAGRPGGYKPVLAVNSLQYSFAEVFDGFIQRPERDPASVETNISVSLQAALDRQWFVPGLWTSRRQAELAQPERLSFQALLSGGFSNGTDRTEILTAAIQSRELPQVANSSDETITNRARASEVGSVRQIAPVATGTPAMAVTDRSREDETASDNRAGNGARGAGADRQRDPAGDDPQRRGKPVTTPEIRIPNVPGESTNVPEPATIILLGSGLALLAAGVRRRMSGK